ncbi:MAG: hypothetical protein JST85_21670 [Acidobacteria bacterium]|nr:hypothetical protein [Acidobacteriota bacterium]
MLMQTKKSTPLRKLHSIHSLLVGREFLGEIETGKAKQRFAYSPASVSLADGKIELTGNFTVKSAGQSHKVEAVKATLLATQGNIQSPPPIPDGASASMLGVIQSVDKPATDATGSRASISVMYFKLSALNGAKLGVPFDLSSLQLNTRLNPQDETARALQFWFSAAVQAVMGESRDGKLATESLSRINQLLKA